MALRIVFLSRSLSDIESIAEYIAADSPTYARTVVKRIVDSTRKLGSFPRAGKVVPEFADTAVREIFAYSYRIIYRIYEDRIVIAAVVHGKWQI